MIPMLLRSGSKRAVLTYRHISQFTADPAAKYERPTPVVLLSGEGCSSRVWSILSDYLSKRGYGGTCIEYPVIGHSFEEMANLLHQQIVLNKFTPPIVVAHSLSTFVAQKYLESYALSGLVLINPILPTATPSLTNLNSQWNDSLASAQEMKSSKKEISHAKVILDYYGVLTGTEGSASFSELCTWQATASTTQPFFSSDKLLHKYLDGQFQDDTVVNLERGAVPTLIVTTDGDSRIISPEELDALVQLHAVSSEDVLHFASPSRAPMITADHRKLNEHIFNWIEAAT